MTDGAAGRPIGTPAPARPPRYDRRPRKVAGGRPWSLEDALDGAFFLLGTVLILWLAWILLTVELRLSWLAVVCLVAFWILVAYVVLPRLQEVLARIYVPDYFIGRTLTGVGVLGDPINIAVDGTEQDIHAAMTAAGWSRADELTLRSSWGIIVSAVFRRPYPTAPVSPLYLFDRREAFAYEQEVDGNAAQRHHVRFWPVPHDWALPGGYRVGWLAAATYDRAVGLSTFTLQVTHKVDSDIDIERDYVVATVRFATPAVPVRVIDDFATAFHARNGGGDLVRTDGSLPVLDLSDCAGPQPAAADPGETATAPTGGRRLAALRLPPPPVLFAGLMVAAKLALLAVGSISQVTTVAASVAIVGLWLATALRHRWGRTMLMAVCAAEAIGQFTALTRADTVNTGLLITTSISVLILVAASSTDARRWSTRTTS